MGEGESVDDTDVYRVPTHRIFMTKPYKGKAYGDDKESTGKGLGRTMS